MINELVVLADALDRAGIAPEDWHPDLKLLPKASRQKPCYRIVLAENGRISEISVIKNDLVPSLRKYEPSNGASFPGFNIQPLFRIALESDNDTGKEAQKKLKAWRDKNKPEPIDMNFIRSWMCEENNNWDQKFLNKLERCLKKVAESLGQKLNKEENPELSELVMRSSLIETQFRPKLIEYIQSFESLPVELLRFLIHEGDASKNSDPKKLDKDRGNSTLSVFLELDDWNMIHNGKPIANHQTIAEINKVLLDSINKDYKTGMDDCKVSKKRDAYGESPVGSSLKMPPVMIPKLGKVILRAMNSESPCQQRYDTIDAASFSVGNNIRKQVKGALEWLTKKDHEGETWRQSGPKELMFAFPEVLPEVPVPLASFLGTSSNGMRFADEASKVIKSLQGLVEKERRDIAISVFALRKLDKARTKVVFGSTYTAQGMIEAANSWQMGCLNIPRIIWRQWGKKKGEAESGGPVTPYPLQVADCLNYHWKLDGTLISKKEGKAKGREFQPSDGVSILMGDASTGMNQHFLSIAIRNGSNLLRYVGGKINSNQVLAASQGIQVHKKYLPSILGLLLYKLNIPKEQYMKNAPYLIGQLLKISDEVHALYCQVVRDKQYPSQLLGNALMPSALESPPQALAILAQRLAVYIGWAKTHRLKPQNPSKEGETFTTDKHAGWLVSLYESIADQMAAEKIPEFLSDADRAQLLLGYLASHPKKDRPETEEKASTF